jgi:shikimate kinase
VRRQASAGRNRNAADRGVILVGFMGAGKTSVGRDLAHRLGWHFEDLDERIERREHRRVHEIFHAVGESGFRRAESAALRELLEQSRGTSHKIVALGGGAFAQKVNVELIEASGVPTVFLDGDAEELWQRCRLQAEHEGTDRPLLSTFGKFRSRYRTRRRHYLKATFRHSTSGKTVDRIALELIDALGLMTKRRRQGDKN